MTEDKRNNYPEEKTGLGRPKTEGKRRTPDKKTVRTENGKRSGIHRNKAVLNRHRAHKTGHSRPHKPPPCNITAARQTKEDFHGLLMGTAIRDGPDKPVTAKANTHTYRTKNRKTEQEGPSSHPVTVAMGTVPQARQKDRKRKKKQSERQQKRPKAGHRKPHPRQIRSLGPEYLCKKHTRSCIYTVYHTLRLSQTENQSEANGFTFGAQNGDDWPGTENGTAENGKKQASGPRKHPLRTAARIYPKEKRDTS